MERAEALREEILQISGVNPRSCMKCGKCAASCPCYDEMEYHPNEFVSMVEHGEIEPLLHAKGIYRCLSCMACLQRCPRQVEPAKLIEAVRLAIEREKDGSHMTAQEMVAKLEDQMPQQMLVSAMRKFNK